MNGGEGVKTLNVATLADAGDPAPETRPVLIVDTLHRTLANGLTGGPHPAGPLDARDGPIKSLARHPEARRHAPFGDVLYDARPPERTTGGNPERLRLASELAGYRFAVSGAFSHQLSAISIQFLL